MQTQVFVSFINKDKMFSYFKLFILLCAFHYSHAAVRLPSSPCPNVFAYEGDVQTDRWYGVINFSSNVELMGLTYKVQLDRRSQLFVSWDGEVHSEDNVNYNVFNPYHKQQAGEVVKARIMVKFNPYNGIPGVTRIIINGITMCAANQGNRGSAVGIGLSHESTTERFDPSFNENEDITAEFSNNRGQTNNFQNNSPGYNNIDLPTRPSSNVLNNVPNYDNSNPSYHDQNVGSADVNFGNSNTGSGALNSASNNQNGGTRYPVYTGSEETGYSTNSNNPSYSTVKNNPNYDGDRVTNLNNRPQWSEVPTDNNNPSYHTNKNNPNYGSQSNPNSLDRVTVSNNNRPQSSEGSSGNNNNNRATTISYNWPNAQNSGFSNSVSSPSNHQSATNVNNESIVTTLTLPSNLQNNKSNNIDQIVQIIKNQLEQQYIANKTVIVAVVDSPTSTVNPVTTTSSFSSLSEQMILSRTSINSSSSGTSSTTPSNKSKLTTLITKQPGVIKPTKD